MVISIITRLTRVNVVPFQYWKKISHSLLYNFKNSYGFAGVLNQRFYGHGPPVTKPMLTDRVMLVLKLYDKIDPNKLTLESSFIKDFGLDSLDHVELVMAMEEEFNFEIPDSESERFHTPSDIVRYLCDKYDLYD